MKRPPVQLRISTTWRFALVSLLSSGLGCVNDVPSAGSKEKVLEPSFVIGPINGGDPTTQLNAAKFFAPVFYQRASGGIADHLTKISFDNDWNGRNQWEDLDYYPTRAYVYVSLVEDQNYFFLHYGTYHPRDNCDSMDITEEFCPLQTSQHENDLEGLKLVVDKRFTTSAYPYGQVLMMETIYHSGFKVYRNCALAGGYPFYIQPRIGSAWHQSWDGCLPMTADYNNFCDANSTIKSSSVHPALRTWRTRLPGRVCCALL